MAQLLPFSRPDVFVGGNRGIVNATTHTNGPSWRMIVSLEIHHLPKLCIRVDKAGIREAGTMIILLTTGQQESITIFSISGQPKKLLHMPCYTSLLNNHEEPDLS